LGSLVNNTFDDVVVMEIWLEGGRDKGENDVNGFVISDRRESLVVVE
jgi:hypothetical protein